MWRAIGWTLRQPRYRAIAALMTGLAVAFAGIGTFEVHRFNEKRHDNGVLRSNAAAPTVALGAAVVPLVGSPRPDDADVRYRTATTSGVYLGSDEKYVDGKTQGGRQGFLVLTPLRTSAGVLLVARGFVASTSSGARPASVAAPPTGTVRVTGLLYPGETKNDQLGRLGNDEITAVNPVQQAARLGTPTFQAYLALTRGQPGTAGLKVLPRPDLSNPTGGAGSLQLLSYVLQWYAFALLALCAPFLIARNEVRDARRRFLGIDPDAAQFDLEAMEAAALEAPPGTDSDGALVLRRRADVARVRTPGHERAERLADRYGRSLGPAGANLPAGVPAARRSSFVAPYERDGSANPAAPHRSEDAYHGSYNDYLWQLALADGDIPDVEVLPPDPARGADPAPRIIEGDVGPDDRTDG